MNLSKFYTTFAQDLFLNTMAGMFRNFTAQDRNSAGPF